MRVGTTVSRWIRPKATLCLGICGLALWGTAPMAHAAEVDNFDAAPAMKLFQAKERGCSYSVETAPAGGTGKAAKIAWAGTHEGFFELYYNQAAALPSSVATQGGKLHLKVYCDTPNAVSGLALRIKSAKDEIFHFHANAQLPAHTWQDVEFDVRQGEQKGNWGGDGSGKLVGPLTIAGYGVVVDKAAPAGSIWIDQVSWEETAAAAARSTATSDGNIVDSFEGSPAMSLYQGTERGVSYAVQTAPASGQGKAAEITWKSQHGEFFELYYARDIVLPDTQDKVEGKLRLKLYADTAQNVSAIAVRIKDSTGEIFHFATPARVPARSWQEVSLDINQTAHTGHWGGANAPTMSGPLMITGYGISVDKAAPAGSLWIDDVSWASAAPTAAPQAHEPTPIEPASRLLGRYPLENANLLQPFWRSHAIKGESVLFIQERDGEPATGTLLFAPAAIQRVIHAREGTVYELGKDYTVDAAKRRLVLTQGSRIPYLKRQELYKPKGAPQAVREKAGDPNTWLLYAEAFFQGKQVEVNYITSETWTGYQPQFAGAALGKVIDKLKAKQAVRIVVTGDSISAGANASWGSYAPHMPAYVILLAAQLEKTYGAKVELVRLSVPGATTDNGLAHIQEVIDAHPDLTIIAYGMNDVAGHNPASYARNVQAMVDAVRKSVPDSAFILVASSCANPEWSWSPRDQFVPYRDALAGLCGGNVVLADATALWQQILERKRYHDLAGNGINHPNDYGHRLMAQLLIGLLIENEQSVP